MIGKQIWFIYYAIVLKSVPLIKLHLELKPYT